MSKLLWVVILTAIAIIIVVSYAVYLRDRAPAAVTANEFSFNRQGYVYLQPEEFSTEYECAIEFSLKTLEPRAFVAMVGNPATIENPTSPFLSVWVDNKQLSVVINQSFGRIPLKPI